jgi:hypothetical protein
VISLSIINALIIDKEIACVKRYGRTLPDSAAWRGVAESNMPWLVAAGWRESGSADDFHAARARYNAQRKPSLSSDTHTAHLLPNHDDGVYWAGADLGVDCTCYTAADGSAAARPLAGAPRSAACASRRRISVGETGCQGCVPPSPSKTPCTDPVQIRRSRPQRPRQRGSRSPRGSAG